MVCLEQLKEVNQGYQLGKTKLPLLVKDDRVCHRNIISLVSDNPTIHFIIVLFPLMHTQSIMLI